MWLTAILLPLLGLASVISVVVLYGVFRWQGGTEGLRAEPEAARVAVHGPLDAPRPAMLPRTSLPLQTHSSRQRCGEGLREGLGEGNRYGLLCLAPPARERLRCTLTHHAYRIRLSRA
jgi:hypothetical protein